MEPCKSRVYTRKRTPGGKYSYSGIPQWNRFDCLKRKAYELSVLTEAAVCFIFQCPKLDQPQVWPEDPAKLRLMLMRYLSHRRRKHQKKKPQGVEEVDVFKGGIHEKCKSFLLWDKRLDWWSASSLQQLLISMQDKLNITKERIQLLKQGKARAKAEANTIGGAKAEVKAYVKAKVEAKAKAKEETMMVDTVENENNNGQEITTDDTISSTDSRNCRSWETNHSLLQKQESTDGSINEQLPPNSKEAKDEEMHPRTLCSSNITRLSLRFG